MAILSSKYIDVELSDVYSTLIIEYAKNNQSFLEKCRSTSPSVSVITTETHNTDTGETKRVHEPIIRFPSGFTSTDIMDLQEEVKNQILKLIKDTLS